MMMPAVDRWHRSQREGRPKRTKREDEHHDEDQPHGCRERADHGGSRALAPRLSRSGCRSRWGRGVRARRMRAAERQLQNSRRARRRWRARGRERRRPVGRVPRRGVRGQGGRDGGRRFLHRRLRRVGHGGGGRGRAKRQERARAGVAGQSRRQRHVHRLLLQFRLAADGGRMREVRPHRHALRDHPQRDRAVRLHGEPAAVGRHHRPFRRQHLVDGRQRRALRPDHRLLFRNAGQDADGAHVGGQLLQRRRVHDEAAIRRS